MKFRICAAAAACVFLLSAQTPNLSGVWKANLEKSKLTGPPSTGIMMIIEQKGSSITETVGTMGQRGEQRAGYTFDTSGKASRNSFRGLPMRTQATIDGSTLVLDSKVVGGPQPSTVSQKFTLSPDGNTLTLEERITANGKETPQTIVFEKQPESAGEALRKPEETAGVRFKNVQVMKDVPASRFLDSMRSFSMSLGTNCEHCHVQGKFDADDKPAKAMARKMITMTHNINEQTFAGKMEVRCYTCHQGKVEPQSTPSFN